MLPNKEWREHITVKYGLAEFPIAASVCKYKNWSDIRYDAGKCIAATAGGSGFMTYVMLRDSEGMSRLWILMIFIGMGVGMGVSMGAAKVAYNMSYGAANMLYRYKSGQTSSISQLASNEEQQPLNYSVTSVVPMPATRRCISV